jgi:hypothetical protein
VTGARSDPRSLPEIGLGSGGASAMSMLERDYVLRIIQPLAHAIGRILG